MGYRYDLFISYSRRGNVLGWVKNHLYPVLKSCLEDELPRRPEIFIDDRLEVGGNWPNELANALLHSRMLLAVWSPPYFRSSWCLAEWQSMVKRQELLGMGTRQNPSGLVYPVVFSDGEHFPNEARVIQGVTSFKEWQFPYPQFRETAAYLDFHAAVSATSSYLAGRINTVPDWCPDWPVETPAEVSLVKVERPRI
jgi:hypothetical protein